MTSMLCKGSVIVVCTLAAVCALFTRVHAQQNKGTSNGSPVTTNWMGYLVIGSKESMDSIAPGPHPTTEPRIEIGLRSDGVVIWRRASN